MAKLNRKQKKRIYQILFLISACVFLFCAGLLLYFWWDYHKADEEYRQVAENAVTVRQDIPSRKPDASEGSPAAGGNGTALEIIEDENPPMLLVDFDELEAANEDVVAWLDFPGQSISYPVVQGDDNSHYLRWSFSGTSSSSGAIFLDYRNEGLMKDGNTIIYGHNMRNGSMFGLLRRYQEQSHYEEFPFFDVYTREGTYRCAIISAGRVRPYEESYKIMFTSDEDRADYISLVKERQYYELPEVETDFSVDPAPYMKVLGSSGDGEGSAPPLVLLSTCTGGGHEYRFVLLAQVLKFYPAD